MRKLFLLLFFLPGVIAEAQTPINKLLWKKPPILWDIFTDANGTNLSAHGMLVGSGWTAQQNGLCGSVSNITIQSNAAQPGVGFLTMYTAEAGVSDYVASLDLAVPNRNNYVSGIVYRFVSCSDYWAIFIERDAGGTPYLGIMESAGGVRTIRASVNVPGATNSTLNIKITLSGSSMVALAGTGETCNYSSALHGTSTKVGLLGYDDSGSYGPGVPVDNFLVTK